MYECVCLCMCAKKPDYRIYISLQSSTWGHYGNMHTHIKTLWLTFRHMHSLGLALSLALSLKRTQTHTQIDRPVLIKAALFKQWDKLGAETFCGCALTQSHILKYHYYPHIYVAINAHTHFLVLIWNHNYWGGDTSFIDTVMITADFGWEGRKEVHTRMWKKEE